MTVLASIGIESEEFRLGEALAATTTRIELTQFVPVESQLVPYFWKEHDGDRESFEQSVREHSAVADLEDLDGRVNASLYRIEWAGEIDGLLGALRDQDIMVEEAATSHGDRWLFELRALDEAALSAFQRDCHDSDVLLDVRRVHHNPSSGHESRALVGVTEKQREALSLALERGYFQVPRETSAGELGEELGISRQAFSRRLHRGQQSVLTNLLTGMLEG